MNVNQLLIASTAVGQALLENGAEIYRVEESVERIVSAYDVVDVNVYAVPNTIIVSITMSDNTCLTKTKRIRHRGTNLDRVQGLNDLSRRIVIHRPDFEMIMKELETIDKRPVYDLKTQLFAYALTSSTFALFFGGTFNDALCALLIGPVVRLVSFYLGLVKANPFFVTIACSLTAGILGIIGTQFSIGNQFDKIIIGVVMNLVPGVALTNSVRDLIAGDMIAGQAKLVEAILTATCIAVGTGTAVSLLPLFQ